MAANKLVPPEKPAEESVEENRYNVREITTDTQEVIYDGEEEESLDVQRALAKILNELDEIKKALTG